MNSIWNFFRIADLLRLLETLIKAIHATSSVNQHLLARKKRMRFGVNFQHHTVVFKARARFKC